MPATFLLSYMEANRMRLKNKVVIITGAGSGIGEETAFLFAKEGAKVVVADINKKAGEKVTAIIKALGADAFFVEVDVSDTEQVNNMVTQAIKKYGEINVLINNGGIVKDAFLTNITDEQIDSVIAVNQKGPLKCARAAAQIMMNQKKGGVIINTSSVVAFYGNKGQVVYSGTKAAMIGITKTLAKELGPKGIRVNAVAPGFIKTPMTANVPEKILEMMKERTPLRALGEPLDIAYAYLFLASDEARFVNGAVLCVDGGLVT